MKVELSRQEIEIIIDGLREANRRLSKSQYSDWISYETNLEYDRKRGRYHSVLDKLKTIWVNK